VTVTGPTPDLGGARPDDSRPDPCVPPRPPLLPRAPLLRLESLRSPSDFRCIRGGIWVDEPFVELVWCLALPIIPTDNICGFNFVLSSALTSPPVSSLFDSPK